MPLPTDELIRKADPNEILQTNVQALVPQIWAAQLEVNLRKKAVFQQTIVDNGDLLAPGAGDTVFIPILPDQGPAPALTEGTVMTFTAITNGQSVPLKPTEYGSTFEITRKALDRIKYDGAVALLDHLAYQMSQTIEQSIAALYAHTVPSIGGSLSQLYPNGHASGTIVAADNFSDTLLHQGIAKLQQANASPFEDGNWILVMTPGQFKYLYADSNARQDLRFAAPGDLLRGEVGQLGGCRIIVSNYCPSTGGSQTDPQTGTSYSPAAQGAGATVPVDMAYLISPRWAFGAFKRRPEVVVDPTLYDMGRVRRFGAVADFDIEVVHSERAVVLVSAQ